MIPNNYKLPERQISNFEPLPQDTYEAEITSIELLADQPVYNQPNQTEDMFKFEFTILDDNTFTGADGSVQNTKGRKVWHKVRTTMNAGYNGKSSWLYRIFCAVFACFLSDEEARSVSITDINEMEGKKVRILVKQKPSKTDPTKIFNNVTDVLPTKLAVQKRPVLGKEPQEQENLEEEINVEDIPF